VLRPDRYDLADPGDAWLGAVLLHPHPSYGGDRHNIVVDALFRTLPGAGVSVVRFDFDSDDIGRGVADSVEAIDLLPAELGVAVVGYSFGAVVAAQVVHERVSGWVLVAPPFGAMASGEGAAIASDPRPKLVLAAEHDQFCPPDEARRQVGSWAATELEQVSGGDHFMGGATARVGERVVEFLSRFRPA